MEELNKEFIEYLSMMAKSFGLNDLMVKVFAILYIEPEEIAMEDIAKKSGYSLASICNTIKMLENMGAIKRIRKPGTKKVFFYMGKDMVKWNIMKLEFAHRNIIIPAKERLPKIIKKYKEKVKNERDKKKLKIIENYYNQVIIFEKIFNKWKKDLQNIISK